MLYAACKVEVEERCRKFNDADNFKHHVFDVSNWLTSDEPTFGLFLCGGSGNGKTTLLKSFRRLMLYLTDGEAAPETEGCAFVTAKELVRLAKAYSNPTKENAAEAARYKKLLDFRVLCIDDLGTEPRESMTYGDFVTAAIDVLSYRYDKQLTTLASSNLAPSEISTYYDARIADRFREMMHFVIFGEDKSFRTAS